MTYKWGNTSNRRMSGVNKDLVLCATIALKNSRYDMTIPWMGGVRTEGEQNHIYEQGNSRCDGINIKSYHQSGNALDIMPVRGDNAGIFYHFAKEMYEAWQRLLMQGEVKGVLVWGGHFGKTGWDKRHWEIRN